MKMELRDYASIGGTGKCGRNASKTKWFRQPSPDFARAKVTFGFH